VRPVHTAEISVVLVLPNVKVSIVPLTHLPSEPSILLTEKVKKKVSACVEYDCLKDGVPSG